MEEDKPEIQGGLLRKENDKHVDKSKQMFYNITSMMANLWAKKKRTD